MGKGVPLGLRREPVGGEQRVRVLEAAPGPGAPVVHEVLIHIMQHAVGVTYDLQPTRLPIMLGLKEQTDGEREGGREGELPEYIHLVNRATPTDSERTAGPSQLNPILARVDK